MNLYLISQHSNDGYGIYRSAVVCAASENDARNMSPASGLPMDWANASPWDLDQWVSSPDLVIVEHIGTALPSRSRPVVICANYIED
jgi:hypothetical protein